VLLWYRVCKLLATVLVVAVIGVPYDALSGEYGLAWQVMSSIIIVPVLLIGLIAWLVLLDRKFGWGLTRSLPDTNHQASSEEMPARDDNHGAAENQLEAPNGSEAGTGDRTTRGRRIPHPDDPLPVEVNRTPKEEDEATRASPSHSRPKPEPDIYYHIRRLAELRDAGIMDSKEFEAKKSELLDRI